MQTSAATLHALRGRFAGLPSSAAKQLGLRYIRDALRLAGRNPAEESRLAGLAAFHLPYAEAARDDWDDELYEAQQTHFRL